MRREQVKESWLFFLSSSQIDFPHSESSFFGGSSLLAFGISECDYRQIFNGVEKEQCLDLLPEFPNVQNVEPRKENEKWRSKYLVRKLVLGCRFSTLLEGKGDGIRFFLFLKN